MSRHLKRKGRVRRAVSDLFGEMVGEAILAGTACLLLAGLTVAALWGWHNYPNTTALAGVAVAAFLAYGAFALFRQSRRDLRQRASRIAAAAMVVFTGVAFWLGYVLAYCSCTK